ncbi:MAG: response regulator [Thermoanaerobaculia bacterium]
MSDRDTILLIEQCEADAEVTTQALRAARLANPIVRVPDAGEALALLLPDGKSGRSRMGELPCVVILDVRGPLFDSVEFLRLLRASVRTAQLPVVVLSSAVQLRMRIEDLRFERVAFIEKPLGFANLTRATMSLGFGIRLVDDAARR